MAEARDSSPVSWRSQTARNRAAQAGVLVYLVAAGLGLVLWLISALAGVPVPQSSQGFFLSFQGFLTYQQILNGRQMVSLWLEAIKGEMLAINFRILWDCSLTMIKRRL